MKGLFVSAGLLEKKHRKRIGAALWEFLWLIEKEFKPKDGEPSGVVSGGDPVAASRIAADLGIHVNTVRSNLIRLESQKYIRSEAINGKASRYYISDPKRWQMTPSQKTVVVPPQKVVAVPYRKLWRTTTENCERNKELDSLDSLDSKSSPPKDGERTADPRQLPIQEKIKALWLKANPTVPTAPWEGREAGTLAQFLRTHKPWQLETILTCIVNRFASDATHCERPALWLPKLDSYLSGPLDKYQKPKGATNGDSKGQRIQNNVASAIRDAARLSEQRRERGGTP
jgi:hypothetical protein